SMKDVFRSGDSSKKFKIAEGQWYRYAPSYVSPAYHLLEGFPFIQEPPSGDSLHTKRQNLFQELDAVIHLLMEAKHWGLRKSRNATSLNSRFKSLDTLKVKIISVTFRRVIRTNHKKASKIWRHENIQLGG